MSLAFDVSVPRLTQALTEQPSLVLSFYSYGILLRKRSGDTVQEYPIDPQHVATALAAKMTFDTGLMTDEILLVRQEGVKKTVVGYRPAQKTGLYLDGSETALRVPLPPLILIRQSGEGQQPQSTVYAVKSRPKTLDAALFHTPLPNVFNSGSICWGSVRRATDTSSQTSSLVNDWAMLLGSPFGDHACSGKSKSHPQDIRQALIALETRKARVYPTSDLIPLKKTLAQVLGGVS